MFRPWILWTLLIAFTCGLAAGCTPNEGKPGGTTTMRPVETSDTTSVS